MIRPICRCCLHQRLSHAPIEMCMKQIYLCDFERARERERVVLLSSIKRMCWTCSLLIDHRLTLSVNSSDLWQAVCAVTVDKLDGNPTLNHFRLPFFVFLHRYHFLCSFNQFICVVCIENQIIFKIKSTLLNVIHMHWSCHTKSWFRRWFCSHEFMYSFSLLFFVFCFFARSVRILVSVSIADLWLQWPFVFRLHTTKRIKQTEMTVIESQRMM